MRDEKTDQNFERVFQLLDVISVEVALNRNEMGEFRKETRLGFQRVERRLGNIESRLEALEDRRGRR